MLTGSRLITQAERTELDTQLRMSLAGNLPLRVRKRDRLFRLRSRSRNKQPAAMLN